MGPRRNRAPLRQVLAEPLLSVILEQAAQAQTAGWFWTYKLEHIKVSQLSCHRYDVWYDVRCDIRFCRMTWYGRYTTEL